MLSIPPFLILLLILTLTASVTTRQRQTFPRSNNPPSDPPSSKPQITKAINTISTEDGFSPEVARQAFTDWIRIYSQRYPNERTRLYRFSVFMDNARKVRENNQKVNSEPQSA